MGILQPTAGRAGVNVPTTDGPAANAEDGLWRTLDCFADRAEVKRYVGYLPDEPVFYDYLRGGEILRFVGEMHGLRPAEIERQAQPLVDRLDLADALGEYAVNYSRGMKKKLAAICSLLHDPEVLIMDEPTNGLDPFATRTMHELIRKKARAGKSVFFSTHLLDQAERLCDRVGILNKGRIAAVGRLEELRAHLSKDSSLEEIFLFVQGQLAGGDLLLGHGRGGRQTS